MRHWTNSFTSASSSVKSYDGIGVIGRKYTRKYPKCLINSYTMWRWWQACHCQMSRVLGPCKLVGWVLKVSPFGLSAFERSKGRGLQSSRRGPCRARTELGCGSLRSSDVSLNFSSIFCRTSLGISFFFWEREVKVLERPIYPKTQWEKEVHRSLDRVCKTNAYGG